MRHIILLGIFLAATTSATVSGAILIESVDASGTLGTVQIEGDYARINHAITEGYMLLNLVNDQAYAISTKGRYVMDLSTPFVQRSPHGDTSVAGNTPEIKLKKQGKGPLINNFTTEHYQVFVKDEYCFDEFLAVQPITNPQIQRFLQVVSRLSTSHDEIELSLLFDDLDPCEIAADSIDDQYPDRGIPMRTIRDGKVVHEIRNINTEIKFPAGTFDLPPEFPVLSRREVQDRVSRKGYSDAELEEVLKKNRAIQQQIEDMTPQQPGMGPTTIDLLQ